MFKNRFNALEKICQKSKFISFKTILEYFEQFLKPLLHPSIRSSVPPPTHLPGQHFLYDLFCIYNDLGIYPNPRLFPKNIDNMWRLYKMELSTFSYEKI